MPRETWIRGACLAGGVILGCVIVALWLVFGMSFSVGMRLVQGPQASHEAVSNAACFERGIALVPDAVKAISVGKTVLDGTWVVTLHHHGEQRLSFWLRGGEENQAVVVKNITLY